MCVYVYMSAYYELIVFLYGGMHLFGKFYFFQNVEVPETVVFFVTSVYVVSLFINIGPCTDNCCFTRIT